MFIRVNRSILHMKHSQTGTDQTVVLDPKWPWAGTISGKLTNPYFYWQGKSINMMMYISGYRCPLPQHCS